MLLTVTPAPTPVPTVTVTVMPVPTPSPAVTVVVAGLGQRDGFDVWASIVIPSVVGLATLALTGVSLWVAWQAFKTAKRATDLEESRAAKEERAKRAALGYLLENWYFDFVIQQVREGSPEQQALLTQRSKEVARDVAASSEPSAATLRSWLIRRSKVRQLEEVGPVALRGWEQVREWVAEPASIERKVRREALMGVLEREAEEGAPQED